MSQARILFLDTETAPAIVTTFSLYPDSINHTNILQDWYIICACWKWQGNNTVYFEEAKTPTDDKKVLVSLSAAINNADILVGHNLKRFDIRKINARLIYHGLPPLPNIPMVDTLTETKKVAQFTSHRLDYLGKHLLGAGKLPTSEGLWQRALKGEKKAVKEMVDYCKVDVVRLEQLYNKLVPYFKTHPHKSVIEGGEKCDCPRCGGVKMQKRGFTLLASGNKRQRLQCMNPVCRSWHSVALKDVK